MAKRVKSAEPELIAIVEWDQADELLKKAAELVIRKTTAEHMAAEDINGVKAFLAAEVKPINEEIDLITRSLDVFSRMHKEDFGDKRSKKLNFGTIGWRKSTAIAIKKTTLELIKKVFRPSLATSCVRLKEEVDKEGLAKLTDEQLADVDARRKETDIFFVEPDLTEAADYQN